ncbi:MAG TPA: DUF4350 domain-containing protein [Thermoanaerobaculia bacterium]|nr:DUF4350 domain-containing protein [Thermoanaerobaculia bacterium]
MRGALLLALLASAPALAAGPVPPVVLFDEGHGQLFRARGDRPLDLSALAGVVTGLGGSVRSSRAPLTPESLAGVRALVVSGPFAPVSVAESEAVVAWVEAGGSLVVMLHIESPLHVLLSLLGVAVTNGVLREEVGVIGGEPLNFRVSRFAPHPLTKGLAAFSVYGAWGFRPAGPGVEAVATTSDRAWLDKNRDGVFDAGDSRHAFDVAVAGRRGQGRFAAFGDDAMFQNQFLKGDNRQLARNLFAWLLGGAGTP